MEYTTFSIRLPKKIVDALNAEAFERFRKRNQLITDILLERYHSHAPPTVPVQQQSTKPDVTNGQHVGRNNTPN